ncbi:MAG: glutathione S-transferase family protein [Thermoplasmatota archaeon]
MPGTAKPRLFYLRPSHYCEKARAILQFKKIPFDLVLVPYGNHQDVIRASGQDYVPWLGLAGSSYGPTKVNADGVEWPDIADWAEKVKPEPSLYPGDAKVMRARSRLVENWAHNVVEEAVWKFVIAEIPSCLTDGQERWIFVELQERKRGPLHVMGMRKQEFAGGVREVCALAEDLLGDKPFLLADAPSLADFALFGALHPLKFTRQEIPKEFEKLRTWHGKVSSIAGPHP